MGDAGAQAARFQLTRAASDAAFRLRHLLLAHPVPKPVPLGGQPPTEPVDPYPLGMVLAQLVSEHTTVLRAVADHPYAVAYYPDTGRQDDLGLALVRLVTALAAPIVRFHGQVELRDRDLDIRSLGGDLRDVLVAASLLLSEIGPLDVDVHRYAQRLPAEVDPRWRAALTKAAAYAEPAWSRGARPEQTNHLLGLRMLAIALIVVSVEYDRSIDDVSPDQLIGLLGEVAWDPMWNAGRYTTLARRGSLDQALAARDRRVEALRTRVETTLVFAGVNFHRPGDAHRDLTVAWQHLQEPAPANSDLTINGEKGPYTWRPHLPEGVIRAAGYLGICQTFAS
jgi:hypothetical protein